MKTRRSSLAGSAASVFAAARPGEIDVFVDAMKQVLAKGV
jgi:hypothetical protein